MCSRSRPCWTGTAIGLDAQARLPLLSTWLGDVDPSSTSVPPGSSLGSSPWQPVGLSRRTGGRPRERPRPLSAGVLHRPARPAVRRPARTRSRPTVTRASSCSPSLKERTGAAPSRAQPRRPRRHADRGVPAAPRGEAGNGSATRNARLAAIHSLFRYAAPADPEHAAVISQVLAIPPRRRERAVVSYLTPEETDALLTAPYWETWHRPPGPCTAPARRPDRAAGIGTHRSRPPGLGAGPHVRCHGKGRKQSGQHR